MIEDTSNIKIFNPSQAIAKEVTLNVIIRHRDALRQAREGIINNEKSEEIPEDLKKINKIKGLFLIISAQRDMINISTPIVGYNCQKRWEKKMSNVEEEKRTKFEEEDNEYNKLIEIKEILKLCELDLINAEETASTKDDYLIEYTDGRGKHLKLTPKYFEMINGLEETYQEIYLIMLKHKIVSAGIEEDEEKTYKELEEEAIRRVIDA